MDQAFYHNGGGNLLEQMDLSIVVQMNRQIGVTVALGNEERELSSVPGSWPFAFRAVKDGVCHPVLHTCSDR